MSSRGSIQFNPRSYGPSSSLSEKPRRSPRFTQAMSLSATASLPVPVRKRRQIRRSPIFTQAMSSAASSSAASSSVASSSSMVNNSILNKYNLIKELGRGAFGIVHLAQNKRTKEQVAIKIIKDISLNDEKIATYNEIMILGYLTKTKNACENCLRLIEYENNRSTGIVIIVTNYIHGKELFDYIADDYSKLTDKSMFDLIANIAQAVLRLHAKKVAHRDLKLENTMISPGDMGITIIDFGLSCLLDSRIRSEYKNLSPALLERKCQPPTGTPKYLSPEIIDYILGTRDTIPDEFFYKSDVWATAMMFYEIYTQSTFYKNIDYIFDNGRIDFDRFLVMMRAETAYLIDTHIANKYLRELLYGMLKFDYVNRWDMRQVYSYIVNNFENLINGEDPYDSDDY